MHGTHGLRSVSLGQVAPYGIGTWISMRLAFATDLPFPLLLLFGGAGADSFRYVNVSDSDGLIHDIIGDFASGVDQICIEETILQDARNACRSYTAGIQTAARAQMIVQTAAARHSVRTQPFFERLIGSIEATASLMRHGRSPK